MPPKAQPHPNPYHQSGYALPATAHSPSAYGGMNPYSSSVPLYAQSPGQHRHETSANGSNQGPWNGNAAASGSAHPPRQVSAGPRILAVAKEESDEDEEDPLDDHVPEATEVKKKTTRGSRACTVVSRVSRIAFSVSRARIDACVHSVDD